MLRDGEQHGRADAAFCHDDFASMLYADDANLRALVDRRYHYFHVALRHAAAIFDCLRRRRHAAFRYATVATTWNE